ncbi:MAG TPA: dipeptidase [Candidatus Limnocylindria bacterium]|nr:dipeptidase [Candidatus Limnocylindria bacterium]
MRLPLEYLASHDAEFVDRLCRYARFPSVSAQPKHQGDLRECAGWIADHCREVGLSTTVYETDGNPIVVAKTPNQDPAKPTFLVYGHYDVQPPEPFELWKTPPFEPRIEGRQAFARGISDNKGQHLAHLNAVEAYLKTNTPLPCNLTFLIEGEEEVGSTELYKFLPQHTKELACQAVVISDNGIPSLKSPALTYSLRGIAALEIRIDGPSRDLHSGLFGGSVENPAMALAQLLAKMRDAKGRITVPGFYDDVAPLSKFERAQLAKLPYKESAYKKLTGVPELFGEAGFTADERRTARPTFEINGLTSGYQGEGSKTIIPAWASAKITIRLVPNQKPAKILAAVKKHLKSLCPPTVRLTIKNGHGGEPYIVPPDGPLAQAAVRAMSAGFGHPTLLMREGGSIPIVSAFKRDLKVDTLLLGMALPDDNAHSPNEKFDLDAYAAGMRMGVHLWPELTAALK